MHELVALWNRFGIRRQLTLAAIAFVAVPLALGTFVLANLLTRSLSNNLIETNGNEAHRIASYVSDRGPNALPGELDIAPEYSVQIVDRDGLVIWSSSETPSLPLSNLRPAPDERLTEGAEQWFGGGNDDNRDVVVAYGFVHANTPLVVLVATAQDDQHEAVKATTALLLASIPLFMVLSAVATWWLVERALRPVRQMTRQVAEITSMVGDERLPLPEATDDIHELGLTMNAMLDRLQQSQDSQRRFVSDASHELRSPVASLQGAIEIARSADDLETWRELSPLMEFEAKRLGQLAQDLLSLSRVDDSGLSLKKVELDLDDLAQDEVQRLRSVGDKEIQASIRPARVVADPGLVRQVLVNLGDNALRHAASTVRIEVSQEPDESALMVVEDDGAGVDVADRDKIFERFVRLEESRNRDEGGSGLGLAIVAQSVRAHGGTVLVTDSSLGGARFEVRLPAGP